jgi:hypothetical protein
VSDNEPECPFWESEVCHMCGADDHCPCVCPYCKEDAEALK